MKLFKRISLLLAAAVVTSASAFVVDTQSADAANINYVTQSGYTVNWGTRGETCDFLSDDAEDFYTGSYTYETLSKNRGGSTQSDAPRSALYSALKSMMKAEHSHETSYGETKSLYRYTDCEENDYNHITSFYSATQLTGNWDGGSTWNREHTWPDSKGLGGNDENDIMMLRPTSVKENSSRGNTAYGASGGYYDPASAGGKDVRGDCARIVLYVYVRWGNTNNMWGKSGVMESMGVLLDWMEEDPVDTWEMGRNDAVESITGTRNVFVDYPEYAWLLFGQSMPSNMTTPSGIAKNGNVGGGDVGDSEEDSSSGSVSDSSDSEDTSGHDFSDWFVWSEATETEDGLMMRTCYICGESEEKVIPKTGTSCEHDFSEWFVLNEATETEDGLQMRSCYICGESEEEIIPKTGVDGEASSEGESEGSVEDEDDTSDVTSVGGADSGEVDGEDNLVSEPGINNEGMAGCGGVLALPVAGIALLAAAGFVLKRRNEKEN